MNKIIFICLIAFLLNTFIQAQQYWEVIKTPVDVDLKRVFYLDSLNLWAAGDSGTIIYSSDKGDNWEIQHSGLENSIHDIFFLNQSLGWAVTWRTDGIDYQSEILNTTDGGSNWTSSDYRHLNIQLNTIFFIDSLNGWIGGEPFDLSYTINGGLEWLPANIDSGSFTYFPIHTLKFSTPQYGFAVGGHVDAVGVAWSTTDGGQSWKAHGIGPDLLLDFVFLDSTNALSLTAELEGFYPTGQLKFDIAQLTWDYFDLNEYVYVTGIDKRNSYETWGVVGNQTKKFIASFDSINTWQLIDTPDSLTMYDIAFTDTLHGIAVGETGNILRYIPKKTVDIEDSNGTELPGVFSLEQNYPNPFNPSTKISYTIPSNVDGQMFNVSLIVYDILGNEIAVLVDEQKSSGNYEIEFNTTSIKNISSGIYFYHLKAGAFSDAKKMVYLK